MLTAADVQGITIRKNTCCDNYIQANADRAALLRDREELVGLLRECLIRLDDADLLYDRYDSEVCMATNAELRCRVLAAIGGTE